MLQFLNLSATLAAVLITQVTSNILPNISKDANNQWLQASTDNLVVNTDDFGRNTLEVTEKVDSSKMPLVLAAVGGGAIVVALSARNAKNRFKLSPTSSQFSLKSESTIRIEQGSRRLQKKLLRLLHDERDTANRLLSQAKLKNPNKSVDWYVEKVIYDLERDRGSY
jgi:hypothetical protein